MNPTRRQFLSAASLAAGGLALGPGKAMAAPAKIDTPFKHSVMGWCFGGRGVKPKQLAEWCVKLGMHGMEGISRQSYKEVMELGLEIAIVSSHGFAQGPCDPKHTEMVVEKLKDGIEVASQIKSKRVITFTGMRYDGMTDDEAATRCVETWKKVMPLAEKKGITICLEHLNSRATEGKMTGHPGYFGDDVDFCVDLIKRVGSNNFKLLFDIYHVEIMNGDVIRRIREYKDYIGHYHTAGNPGRGELDETQEINYPPIIKAIVKTGFTDFVAQEFIPTWDDPFKSLEHGVKTCTVK
ncbi:MAG: TIM barrel protein [Akkermansiaceae bacterium]|jgi:hydroxypyruvate isomerase|tara:strand:- start:558 stop:1442 length:885 start_codon:yes stop_codon:yes gene_type:complete